MNNRFTCVNEKILNFKQRFEMIEKVKLLRENDIIYIRVAEYEYNNIKFNMSVDLDYDMTDFLVEDGTKIDDIRELIEHIINNT